MVDAKRNAKAFVNMAPLFEVVHFGATRQYDIPHASCLMHETSRRANIYVWR